MNKVAKRNKTRRKVENIIPIMKTSSHIQFYTTLITLFILEFNHTVSHTVQGGVEKLKMSF